MGSDFGGDNVMLQQMVHHSLVVHAQDEQVIPASLDLFDTRQRFERTDSGFRITNGQSQTCCTSFSR